MNNNVDPIAVTCQSFINRVVNNLIYKMMKTFHTDITDIHGRSSSDSFQAFKNLDIAG